MLNLFLDYVARCATQLDNAFQFKLDANVCNFK